jgi:tetratricopeptide (TPR) repeat protein
MSSPSRYYALRVAALLSTMLLLSCAALYVLFGGVDGQPRAAIYGNPLATAGDPVQPQLPSAAGADATSQADDQRSVDNTPPVVAAPAGMLQSELPQTGGSAKPRRVDNLQEARRLSALKEWERAIALYDRLHLRNPHDAEIALERARVLGWSGNNLAAARAMAEPISRDPSNTELRVEQARYFWWAGQTADADAAATAVLALSPTHTGADSLRTEIRRAAQPSVVLARQWLREREGSLEHLLLARAYARENRPADAIPLYRVALRDPASPDSLYLELASVAATADSSYIAVMALERYLQKRPGEREPRIRLARAYAWAERPNQAITMYDALLAESDDRALRFERAQMYAWNDKAEKAETDLRHVLAADPAHAPSLKLLGDLARWRGDRVAALALYRRAAAADPAVEGLAEGVRAAEGMDVPAGPVATGVPAPAQWRSHVDAFGDSERFRWLSTRATRSWGSAARSLGLTVHQELSGTGTKAELGSREAHYGAELQTELTTLGGATARANVGARGLGGPAISPTWGAEVGAGAGGASATLSYQHEPAARRAATVAAREADVTSDLVQLTLASPFGEWRMWSRAELERFDSRFGSTDRLAGIVSLRRPLTDELSASVGISALATDGASPVTAGWGPLYWSPLYYISPSIGVFYETHLNDTWSLGGRLSPGYAFVREREFSDRRFAVDRTAVAAAGLDLSYARPQWELAASGDWSGALRSGYHAAALRIRFAFFPVRP